ncbi:MAG: VOC family protein [Candidatus Helarchaeota archaeon]
MEKTRLFKKINQIGIVTTKMDEIIERYEKILGIGPFNILDRKNQEADYNGKKIIFSTKTALAWFGQIQIEINNIYEYPEGGTPHTDWINRRGEGVHHFGIFVDDVDEALRQIEPFGIKCFFRLVTTGITAAYLDTESIFGYIYEFIGMPKRKKRTKK